MHSNLSQPDPSLDASQRGSVLAALMGAVVLPPLVLGCIAAVALQYIGFSLLSVLSAIWLFGRDWIPLIMIILLGSVILLAEVGAFCGFLGGKMVKSWHQPAPADLSSQQQG
ncbi:MAG: hypothetical protein HC893_02195 [Chloroflexaceae bacterium]|nr:hypothetical protein [Chloroflexaceae bacterium]NJL32870.1 hypothetical protein [Chloroflexaceae bacterium]NJO06990.1 hypothetical protein [Chloroflexaceae bacterium]